MTSAAFKKELAVERDADGVPVVLDATERELWKASVALDLAYVDNVARPDLELQLTLEARGLLMKIAAFRTFKLNEPPAGLVEWARDLVERHKDEKDERVVICLRNGAPGTLCLTLGDLRRWAP